MMYFKWYQFSDLTNEQLYSIFSARSQVFVVEQNCVYLDLDDKDSLALHLLGQAENTLVAYMRLFPPTANQNFVKFGRVLTVRPFRMQGHGKKLMMELLFYCNKHYPGFTIKCAAQFYLKKFYEEFGFKAVGNEYEEEGIPHILMEKSNHSYFPGCF